MKQFYVFTFALMLMSYYCGGGKISNNISSAGSSFDEENTIAAPKTKMIKPVVTDQPYKIQSVQRGLADGRGKIWFCTTQGVYRYDGDSFSHFTEMDDRFIEYVSDILEDKRGNIWFGMEGGVIRYDGKKFTSLSIPTKTTNYFYDFLKHASLKNEPDNVPVPPAYIHVFECRNGQILFYTGAEIYRYDEKSGLVAETGLTQFFKTNVWPNDSIRKHITIVGMYEDNKGNNWLTTGGCGSRQELYRMAGSPANIACMYNTCKHNLSKPQDQAAHNNEIAKTFTKITIKGGAHSISYSSILEDRDGNMWFGTYDIGVYRFNGQNLENFSSKERLNRSFVSTIFEDKAGNIWFGTGEQSFNAFNGYGVFRYDGKSLTHFTTKDGLCSTGVFTNNAINSVMEDKAGKLWFSSGGGGICFYDGKTFTNFNAKNTLKSDNVSFSMKDKSGNLWFGTWDLGLTRYDGKTFTNFTEAKDKQ